MFNNLFRVIPDGVLIMDQKSNRIGPRFWDRIFQAGPVYYDMTLTRKMGSLITLL